MDGIRDAVARDRIRQSPSPEDAAERHTRSAALQSDTRRVHDAGRGTGRRQDVSESEEDRRNGERDDEDDPSIGSDPAICW